MNDEHQNQPLSQQGPAPGPNLPQNIPPIQQQSPAPTIQPQTTPLVAPQPQNQTQPSQQPLYSPVPQTFYSGQVANSKISSSKKKLIIFALAIIAVLSIASTSYLLFFTDKKPNSNQNTPDSSVQEKIIEVPEDWKTIDTTFGYTISAPTEWSLLDFGGESTVNGLKQTTKTLSEGDGTLTITTESEPTEPSILVSVGISEYLDKPGKEEYEKKVSSLSDEDASLLEGFGIKKEDIVYKSEKTKIGDKEWLIVETDIPNQYSVTLHLWLGTKAFTMSYVSNDKEDVKKQLETYLLPFAKSLKPV